MTERQKFCFLMAAGAAALNLGLQMTGMLMWPATLISLSVCFLILGHALIIKA